MDINEIKEQLKEVDASLNEIIAKLEDDNNEEDTEELEEESRSLLAKKDELSEKLKKLERKEERKTMAEKINNGQNVATNVTPVAESESRGIYSSLEYRQAFMDYVLTGKEMRTDYTTKTTDIGTVIPTTIMNKIFEQKNIYGKVLDKVTKTNFKGGLSIPTSSAKPTAEWKAEGSVSAKQKKATSSITFGYYKLQVRVTVSLEAETVSLEVFEQTVADNITEAMVVALETAIFIGSGSGQPKGIITDVSATNFSTLDYEKVAEIEGSVDEAYDDTAEYYMTKANFAKYIGLVDDNGQPVARTSIGIDGKPERQILGRKVNVVPASYLNGKFAVIGDLSDYILNSNLQMTFKKYFDEDTDEFINKCTMIADGKLATKQSFIVLNKTGS